MNIEELRTKLTEAGIPESHYCLTGGLPNEAYCIEHAQDGKWHTYYSERGLRSDLQRFDTEHDACRSIYEMIISDSQLL